jgi:hypothetical protein
VYGVTDILIRSLIGGIPAKGSITGLAVVERFFLERAGECVLLARRPVTGACLNSWTIASVGKALMIEGMVETGTSSG